MVIDILPDNMLTVSEVAKVLHVHPNTLRRWADKGIIRSYSITSRGDRRFMRNILLGLRRLDESIIADKLLIHLSSILGSLAILVGVGFFFRLTADLNIGLKFTSSNIFYYASFICFGVLLHVAYIIIFYARWWDQVRKRDKAWMS
jgi:excisionase family DNA binding protein